MSTHGMCWCRWLRLAGIIGLLLLAAADTAMAQAPLGAGPPFLISSVQYADRSPAVAYNPGQHLYVVVWEKNGAIQGASWMNAARCCTPSSSPTAISAPRTAARPTSLTTPPATPS